VPPLALICIGLGLAGKYSGMQGRINIALLSKSAWRRALATWQSVALAAVAAALVWFIAHQLLGHPQPFFAPIAAAIALSTSPIQRARRTVQMVTGVLLGIGIGEALVAVLGTGTAALGVIVFLTMIAARLAGAGFFGEGMMFANQAAASAILIVTLHRHGTGGERAIDAIIGGAVAFVLGVVLFPAHPLTLLRNAERGVLRVLARTLEEAARVLGTGATPEAAWTLRASHVIHQQLAQLAAARSTATANVKVAPRRWPLRSAVLAETDRIAQLDLLANAVLGLVRAAGSDIYGTRPLPDRVRALLAELTDAIRRLAATPQPWPPDVIASVERRVEEVCRGDGSAISDRGTIVASVLRAAADDLAHVIDQIHTGAEKRERRSL
jgi:uncharacterized membrane protein YgaE (UPF0421/DUF939 family)